MRTIEAIRRPPVSVSPDATLVEAASVMESAAIGALCVLDGEEIVGIVTDRDLVCRAIAQRVDHDARIDSVMSSPVVTLQDGADLHDAFSVFRENPIRRLPIVRSGRFVGMLSVDDLLVNLSSDLADLTRPVAGEVIFGQHDPSVPSAT